MATLTRLQYPARISTVQALERGVPAPFPVHALRENQTQNSDASHEDLPASLRTLEGSARGQDVPAQPGSAPVDLERANDAEETATLTSDAVVLSAIYDLQQAVTATLQHILLLSSAHQSVPISRRHSMPSRTYGSMSSSNEPDTPLRSLVAQLMTSVDDTSMQEIPQSTEALSRELRRQVQALSPSLPLRDYQLANALCSLASDMAHAEELTRPTLTHSERGDLHFLRSPADVYESLQRQISRLQSHREEAQSLPLVEQTPVRLVERELLWSRIDRVMDDIQELCREPADPFASAEDRYSFDSQPSYLPPEYDHDHALSPHPPSYEPSDFIYTSYAEKPKRQLDLDDITEAIDHFNRVNPQLVNQRVEMDSGRAERMEMAKLVGAVERLVNTGRLDNQRAVRTNSKGKEKAREVEDDGKLWELIEKASTRRLENQQVDGGMEARLAKAALKERAKRDAFITTLVQHSSAGRMTSQDAVMRPSVRDPNALLTFPEFIRESASVPQTAPFYRQEFAATEPELGPLKEPSSVWSRKKGRDRSLSAPPLAWLRNLGRDVKAVPPNHGPHDDKPWELNQLDVYYVAEQRAQLKTVHLAMTVDGATPKASGSLLAEVLPDTAAGSQLLLVTTAAGQTAIVNLPVPVQETKQPFRAQSKHYDITLNAAPCTSPTADPAHRPLLDADTLSSLSPTSFTCASCSLPLVQSSTISRYNDLPSEYWAELLDAWMCHADQPLPEAAKTDTFTPAENQALVGGSYILFHASVVVAHNVRCDSTNRKLDGAWCLMRCLCGHVAGRAWLSDGVQPTMYRFAKFGVRPTGTSSPVPHIPIASYVVQDMLELVDAHAAYHFVIQDEQESKPRILIWLFNPSVHISWLVCKSYFLPREGSCHGAVVFFKIIGPSLDAAQVLKSLPDFQQAEYLSYPMDVCRRITFLLRESHSAYPEASGRMKGLEKGWLARD